MGILTEGMKRLVFVATGGIISAFAMVENIGLRFARLAADLEANRWHPRYRHLLSCTALTWATG